MNQKIIDVINSIQWTDRLDRLAWRLNRLTNGQQVNVNFQGDQWLKPIDLVSLVLTIRVAYEKTKTKVLFEKLDQSINDYLRIMSIYDLLGDTCIPPEPSRNSLFNRFQKAPSNKHVTLTEMNDWNDVERFIVNLNDVLIRYYPDNEVYREKVRTIVVEACSNGVTHSGGLTYGVVQAYDFQNSQKQVHIAIGDNGIGIPNHLSQKYPELGDADYVYIKKALDGVSGRPGERGGNGLRRIKEICKEYRGGFSIRSGQMTLAVLPEERKRSNMAIFPGTQLNIILFP